MIVKGWDEGDGKKHSMECIHSLLNACSVSVHLGRYFIFHSNFLQFLQTLLLYLEWKGKKSLIIYQTLSFQYTRFVFFMTLSVFTKLAYFARFWPAINWQ